jgi:hypothetical protein
MSHVQRLIAATVVALAFQFPTAMAQPFADPFKISVPPVPSDIQAPAGNIAFLKGQAVGTQNYVCLPSGSSFSWTLFGPQATLFSTFQYKNDQILQQVTTHFFSRNPLDGIIRPTWQSSFDTSAVWGALVAPSTDPRFVQAGAIPWLLLQAAGTQVGPTGGSMLAQTTFIQRLNTSGGVKPATGCSQSSNVGSVFYAPYTADYYFYKAQ